MLKVLFYSYKGGTGRTTDTANIAAVLAQRGHKVMCIDMDIEGPGLSVLFELESEEGHYLQDYLRMPEAFDLEEAIIDVSAKKKEWAIDSGKLFFLPASVGFEKPVNYIGERPRKLIKKLFEEIENSYNVSFLLMDSPSGYGDMAALSMVFSDILLLYFKWSRQHLIGSIKIAEFIKYLKIHFTPIASVVPQPFSPQMKIYLEILKENLEKEVKYSIPEDNELKWNDQVLIFDRDYNDTVVQKYNQIADSLESFRNETKGK